MRFKALTLIPLLILFAGISSCCTTAGKGVDIPEITPLPRITEGEIIQIDNTDFYYANKDTFMKLKQSIVRAVSDRDKYRNMLEAQQ